jgi:hypothetical protein
MCRRWLSVLLVLVCSGFAASAWAADSEHYVVGFKLNSAKVTEEMKQNIAGLLSSWPLDVRVTVSGCTDKTGPRDFNRQLATRRGEAVASLLRKFRPSLDVRLGAWDEARDYRGALFTVSSSVAAAKSSASGTSAPVTTAKSATTEQSKPVATTKAASPEQSKPVVAAKSSTLEQSQSSANVQASVSDKVKPVPAAKSTLREESKLAVATNSSALDQSRTASASQLSVTDQDKSAVDTKSPISEQSTAVTEVKSTIAGKDELLVIAKSLTVEGIGSVATPPVTKQADIEPELTSTLKNPTITGLGLGDARTNPFIFSTDGAQAKIAAKHTPAAPLTFVDKVKNKLKAVARLLNRHIVWVIVLVLMFLLIGAVIFVRHSRAEERRRRRQIRQQEIDDEKEAAALLRRSSEPKPEAPLEAEAMSPKSVLISRLRKTDPEETPKEEEVAPVIVEDDSNHLSNEDNGGPDPFFSPAGIEKLRNGTSKPSDETPLPDGGTGNRTMILVSAEHENELIDYRVSLHKASGPHDQYINPINGQAEDLTDIRMALRWRFEKVLKGGRDRYVEAMLKSGLVVEV